MPPPGETYKVKVITAKDPEEIETKLAEFLNSIPQGSRIENIFRAGPWWVSWITVVYV